MVADPAADLGRVWLLAEFAVLTVAVSLGAFLTYWLYPAQPPWLSSFLLEDVPRYRIEQAVYASEVVRSGLLEKIDEPAPDDLDTAFRRIYKTAPRIKLERPARNKRDADFYRDVATAYRQAVAKFDGVHRFTEKIAPDNIGLALTPARAWSRIGTRRSGACCPSRVFG